LIKTKTKAARPRPNQDQKYKTKSPRPRPVWDRSCHKTAVSDPKTVLWVTGIIPRYPKHKRANVSFYPATI